MEVISDDWPLRVWYTQSMNGSPDTLAVSFSSIGQVHEEYPPPEFFGTCCEIAQHVLFVSDISRCWMNAHQIDEQLTEVIDGVKTSVGARRLYFLGTSMGAFSAIVMSRLMAVDKLLAFSPQYSPMYKHVPEEWRWRKYRSKLRNHKYPTVEANLSRAAKALIIHGGSPDERIHSSRFNVNREGLTHVELRTLNHNLAAILKKRGSLRPLASSFFCSNSVEYLKLLPRPFSVI